MVTPLTIAFFGLLGMVLGGGSPAGAQTTTPAPGEGGVALPQISVQGQQPENTLEGTTGLVARLLYGTGMRIMEGLRLRVKDVLRAW